MESGRPRAEIVEEVDEVQLRKSVEAESYQFPSVELEFISERDDTATVTVRDPIPDDISIEDIGFHRQFGKENWKVDGNQLVFEYDLEPSEEYKTVYGIRPNQVDRSTDLLTTPDSFKVAPEEATDDEAKPVTRSATESPYPDDESTQREHKAGSVDSEASGAVDRKGHPIAETSETHIDIESVADRLAEELQNGDVSEGTLEILEEHLAANVWRSASEDARIRQIQEDVMNLRAYTNALEAFLEEEGSAADIIEEFERKVEDLEGEIENLQARITDLEGQYETVESGLEEVDNSIASVSTEQKKLQSEMNSIGKQVRSIDHRIPSYSIDDRFSDLSEEIESINNFVNNLQSAFE